MKKQTVITSAEFDFLKRLKKNNDRDWFNKNKKTFQVSQDNVVAFFDALLAELNKHDVIETASGKKAVFRIYRDIRFSKDKSPFKNHFSGHFTRATKARRGGYYFHIEPGKSFAAGGFWGPEPEDLKRIRDEFAYDAEPFRKILKSKNFVKYFGKMQGEQIKTTPKGFDADSPAIDLLRYKQFEMIRKFSDKEVLAPGFLKELNETFKQMRPFLNYMTEVLTTDINGESVI